MAKRTVRWKHQWSRRDAVVWIDVAALDSAWRLDPAHYLSAGSLMSQFKYEAFGEWFAGSQERVWMPLVGVTNDAADFTDGRHRFAWMRDHGVEALPIACEPEEADDIRRLFGTERRISRLSHG